MGKYVVTVDKLNQRTLIPESLPDPSSIGGTVFRDFIFEGTKVDQADIPQGITGAWYRGTDGFFYWGGGVAAATKVAALTADNVKIATGSSLSTAQRFLPYLSDTCAHYAINTAARQVCFFAQVGHESASLFYTEELASGSAYEGRKDLGNTESGDGIRYKGRGLIQITGRANYQWLSKDLKVDFVGNPQLLGGKNANACTAEQLKYATLSAGWFWNNHSLNAIADMIDPNQPVTTGENLEQFKLLTKKINGGYNGLADRILRYQSGASALK